MTFDTAVIRKQFPSLDRPQAFLDNPGGTQICRQSLDRIQRYLLECNANHGGAFATSRESDRVLDEARAAMADFLNAPSPENIVFGNNMTTITMGMSRALARTLSAGDELVVTRMDHDANISPWLLIAEDRGCKVSWVDFDVEDATLKLDEFAKALERKPKIVAFGYASNALGTINPVQKMIRMAHDAGALVYVDAVQFAPHGPIDVQQMDADFLVCSSYKFFGPHAGVLYGRADLLDRIKPYKVRPASNDAPHKFETGTQNHEGIAGILGAIEHFEWLGRHVGDQAGSSGYSGRRRTLKNAMIAIQTYEQELSRELIRGVQAVPGTHIYGIGITDEARMDERVPTVSFTWKGRHPRRVAEQLGDAGFYVWDGNYYALAITQRLDLEDKGGMVRIGAAHYNTLDEIARLKDALLSIA